MTDARPLAPKAAEIGILEEDPLLETVYWSPKLRKIFGAGEELSPSMLTYVELTHEDDRDAVLKAILALREKPNGEAETIEHRVVKPNGETRWINARWQVHAPERDGSRQPTRIAASVTDVTDRRKEEERSRRNEARLGAILSIAPNAIISVDSHQTITLFNEAAEKLFGYASDEIIGKPLDLLIPRRFRASHRGNVERFWRSPENARRMGERQNVAGLRKDGSEFPAEASISKIEVGGERIYTVLLQDITERKIIAAQLEEVNRVLEERVAERTRELQVEMQRREEAQNRLIQAQRLEAFGQLTGGVAHDFNNLLAIITGSLELMESDVKSAASREHLERAINAADMGARLTSRLLTFARRRRLEPIVLNLNEQVGGLLELLQRTLGEQILLRTCLADELWLTRADPSEAENAILNLALNARDAMPNGGTLVVETANVTLDEGQAADLKGLTPGDFVRLSVTDSGTGMPPDVLRRVFEPFFTTKGTGRGSGLGLSTIYGFATQSGGTVAIYSEPGQGTTVSLYLPRPNAVSLAEQAVRRSDSILFSRNNELVLVVEDNPAVRETTMQRVEGLGYIVAEASSGREAIGVLNTESDIALVFSDVFMAGGISGYELGQWIRTNKPDVPVVLTSGFTPELTEASLDSQFQVLRKPFSRAELSQALGRALYGPDAD